MSAAALPNNCQCITQQISRLSQLQALGLHCFGYTSDSYAQLAALPALRRLWLGDCSEVPACLSRLTQLEALSCWDEGTVLDKDTADLLAAALPHLTRLTHLAISQLEGAEQAAAALASLPRLQRLVWGGNQPLPPGPYLRSLRSLDTFASSLLASLPALAGATALEAVGLECNGTSPHTLAAALRCADRLPALQELQLAADDALLACVFYVALDAMRHSRVRVSPADHLFDGDHLRQECIGPSPFSS